MKIKDLIDFIKVYPLIHATSKVARSIAELEDKEIDSFEIMGDHVRFNFKEDQTSNQTAEEK